jgi:hypothetical protein
MSNANGRLLRIESSAGRRFERIISPRRMAHNIALAYGPNADDADDWADCCAAAGLPATVYDFFNWLDDEIAKNEPRTPQ